METGRSHLDREVKMLMEGDPKIKINPSKITHCFMVLNDSDKDNSKIALELLNDCLMRCQPTLWNKVQSVKPQTKWKWIVFSVGSSDPKMGYPEFGSIFLGLVDQGVSKDCSIVLNDMKLTFDEGRTQSKVFVGFCYLDAEPRIIYPYTDAFIPDESGGREEIRKNRTYLILAVIFAILFFLAIAQNLLGIFTGKSNYASLEMANAIGSINEGLQTRNKSLDDWNNTMLEELQGYLAVHPREGDKYMDDAKKAVALVNDFVTSVEAIKLLIIAESGGIAENASLNHPQNISTPMNILVKEKQGENLNHEIGELRKLLLSLPSLSEDDKTSLSQLLPLKTDYKIDYTNETTKSWDELTFGNLPVITVIAILNKFQGDAKMSAGLIVEKLLNKVGQRTYRFDNLSAKVNAQSSYVVEGNTYMADIFVLSPVSVQQDPQIYIGKFDPKKVQGRDAPDKVADFPLLEGYKAIPVVNGYGKYMDSTSTTGLDERMGVVQLRQENGSGYDYYPFRFEYRIAEPAFSVRPERANVLFIGVDNPLLVSVPGYEAEDITAAISKNGTVKSYRGREFIANVTAADGKGEVEVIVSVKMSDGSMKTLGSEKIQVKQLPDPIATSAGASL